MCVCVCEISNTHTHTLKSTGISKEGGWDPAAVYGENLSLMFLRFIYIPGLHTHNRTHFTSVINTPLNVFTVRVISTNGKMRRDDGKCFSPSFLSSPPRRHLSLFPRQYSQLFIPHHAALQYRAGKGPSSKWHN